MFYIAIVSLVLNGLLGAMSFVQLQKSAASEKMDGVYEPGPHYMAVLFMLGAFVSSSITAMYVIYIK